MVFQVSSSSVGIQEKYSIRIAKGCALESAAARGEFDAQHPDIATIAVVCAVGYLNFRRVAPGWCVDRPHLVKLVGQLFLRDSFVRTEPPAV